MSARATRVIRGALLKKGFESYETHHEMFFFCVDGKRTAVRTRLSQGNKECGSSLLGAMARQCRLSRSQFEELVDCPMSVEDYTNLLRSAGHIT